MAVVSDLILSDAQTALPAEQVSRFLRQLVRDSGVTEKTLAHAVAMSESQLNRLLARKSGVVRSQTIQPLRRIARVVEKARETLSPRGVKEWLTAPNPYLDDVPPILHLRSEKELAGVLDLLTAIRHGFPA
jgi:uncharacterized protein (DUF2384 family)